MEDYCWRCCLPLGGAPRLGGGDGQTERYGGGAGLRFEGEAISPPYRPAAPRRVLYRGNAVMYKVCTQYDRNRAASGGT